MNGYILISKGIIDSDIWHKPPMYLKVWLYLLIKAMYANDGHLKRGQLFVSIPEIIEACSYFKGFEKVTPSKKEVYAVIEYLRRTDEGDNEGDMKVPMIVTTKVTHGMLVTICNYNKYQDPKSYEGNNEGNSERDMKGNTHGHDGNNIKNEYKEKKKEKDFYLNARAKNLVQIDRQELHFKDGESVTIVRGVPQLTEEESNEMLKRSHEQFAPIKARIALEAAQRIKEREAQNEQC